VFQVSGTSTVTADSKLGNTKHKDGEGVDVLLSSAMTMARSSPLRKLFISNGGVDGARTRDLRRDRPAF
jgi:hypothetical protein